ncbi:MAG: alpha/beta fold hydrolase [Candidatus Eremiobacteraeota bacterium]|nr:alpha/beta fold hydrolase [Candidatus Eremiobacteraeota bacterium]
MQLTVDGTRFDVLDEGRGPAIVLIHGVLLAKETWDAQAAALARRARVVRFDLRGHGASSVPPGPYLMESLAGDVSAVLDALGIERAAIAGHSLGGYVAFAFYRMFAERCSALGLVCTRAAEDDDATANFRYDLAERVEREGIEPAIEAFSGRSFAPKTYLERPELPARLEAINRRTDPRGAAAMLRGMAARVSSEDLYDEIDIPVRIVAGTQDAVIPFAFAEAMATGIRGAELDVLECGHVPLYEEPDALTESLERLLAAGTAAPHSS